MVSSVWKDIFPPTLPNPVMRIKRPESVLLHFVADDELAVALWQHAGPSLQDASNAIHVERTTPQQSHMKTR